MWVGGWNGPLKYSVPLTHIDLLQILRHKEAHGSNEMICVHKKWEVGLNEDWMALELMTKSHIKWRGLDIQMVEIFLCSNWGISQPVHNIPGFIFYLNALHRAEEESNKDSAENLTWCGSNQIDLRIGLALNIGCSWFGSWHCNHKRPDAPVLIREK